jgi:hypothetical protein
MEPLISTRREGDEREASLRGIEDLDSKIEI